jgi:beta-lactamase regulating signal transducer with metallopeptidase domain
METLADRLRMRGTIRLLQTARVNTPLVIGWLRPVILVPLGMVTGLPTVQLDAILLHELAHIRRHDYLVNAYLPIASSS